MENLPSLKTIKDMKIRDICLRKSAKPISAVIQALVTCRAPDWRVVITSLPDCTLLTSIQLDVCNLYECQQIRLVKRSLCIYTYFSLSLIYLSFPLSFFLPKHTDVFWVINCLYSFDLLPLPYNKILPLMDQYLRKSFQYLYFS